MKKNLLALFIFASCTASAQTTSETHWKTRLDRVIKKSGISKSNLSILVSLDDKNHIYSVSPDRMRNPASLTKIFTSATVLQQFSPGHKFLTSLWGKKLSGEILEGGLYLKGGGDPSFVSENMWFLVNEFLRTGIKKVRGGVHVDDTLFDRDLYPQRSKRRVDRAYDAPISAASFNWNSVNIFVRSENRRPIAVFDPINNYIQSQVRLKVGNKQKINVERSARKQGDFFKVNGTLPATMAEKPIFKSITQPSIWTGHNLVSFLKQRGITVEGTVTRKKVPSNYVQLADSESKPISHIVADLMKFSNNYVAEMLTKNLSLKGSKVGHLEGGMEEIRKFVRGLSNSKQNFVLKNASGLTRENRVSVRQVNSALNFLKRRFDLAPEFMNSLPIAGVDGTLKKRMKNTAAKGWVRAKTGLLSGVVGLAGYAGRQDGVVFTFAFIYNGKSGEGYAARKLFDDLATELVR